MSLRGGGAYAEPLGGRPGMELSPAQLLSLSSDNRSRLDSFELRDGLCDDGPQMAPDSPSTVPDRRPTKGLDVFELERKLSLEKRRHTLLRTLTKEIKGRDLHRSFQKAATLIGEEFACSRVIIRSYQEADAADFVPVIQAEWHVPDFCDFLSPRSTAIMNPFLKDEMLGALHEGHALAIPNCNTDERLPENVRKLYQETSIKSWLVAGTFYQGTPNGLISVHQCDALRNWSTEDVDFVTAVADHLGTAFGLVRYQEIERAHSSRAASYSELPGHAPAANGGSDLQHPQPRRPVAAVIVNDMHSPSASSSPDHHAREAHPPSPQPGGWFSGLRSRLAQFVHAIPGAGRVSRSTSPTHRAAAASASSAAAPAPPHPPVTPPIPNTTTPPLPGVGTPLQSALRTPLNITPTSSPPPSGLALNYAPVPSSSSRASSPRAFPFAGSNSSSRAAAAAAAAAAMGPAHVPASPSGPAASPQGSPTPFVPDLAVPPAAPGARPLANGFQNLAVRERSYSESERPGPPPGGPRSRLPSVECERAAPPVTVTGSEEETEHESEEEQGWEVHDEEIQIIERIGQGGSAEIFKAMVRGKLVAVKRLLNQELDGPDVLAFRRELAVLSQLRPHPNVVEFVAACVEPGHIALCFEFLGGGSVADLLHGSHRRLLDFRSVHQLALYAAQGMRHLHRHKLIHRDLKAANLVMDERGVVKIVDFGLARALEGAGGAAQEEAGSYRYTSPEILRNQPASDKSDVYSFGITLWEMVMSQLPYPKMTPIQVALAVTRKGLRPELPEGHANCPPELAALMRACWDEDPAQRPSFEEIVPRLAALRRPGSAAKHPPHAPGHVHAGRTPSVSEGSSPVVSPRSAHAHVHAHGHAHHSHHGGFAPHD